MLLANCSLPGIAELHSAFFRLAGAEYKSAIPGEMSAEHTVLLRTDEAQRLVSAVELTLGCVKTDPRDHLRKPGNHQTLHPSRGIFMSSELEDLVKKALALPAQTRASLAELLLESLDHQEDFPVSDEWLDEIQRRCHAIDAGQVSLIDADAALGRLRQKYP